MSPSASICVPDAVHLASAMVVDDGSIVVVTWDRALASAAGLGAAPPV
jgi:hypothetical protein